MWQKECSCGLIQRERMESRLRFASIPEAYKNIRKDSIKNVYQKPESKKAMMALCTAIKYWIEHFDEMNREGKGLYLYSATKGSGKTMFAAYIANEIMYEKKKMVKFATSVQIINEIKSTWNKSSDTTTSKLLDDLVNAEVLVIDDFGTEKAKDWISEVFYSIINGRYVDKKITIFTSNMSIDSLEYDERITNRIKERNFVIPFPEESVREHIAQQNNEEIKNIIN